ncbi:aldehyde dehydrogenase [Catellatospora sp. TT07R-123]|uniref:aldehyde dehydrogenase family protein n=1 Tax=Catellatospora sp. TT07R-123 TaxID=2733863 RepID=UPI001B2E6D19|nr:aldehyde dehydrogenase family protein [Catellatospora sp. TT07R-123]GHJ45896.1 aldehyde dehydrogenase [Catellatospora sp. TT07R-123]
MRDYGSFYIGGRWVAPDSPSSIQVINPATEEIAGQVSAATPDDVDQAVGAARQAFPSWSQTSPAERALVLDSIIAEYLRRADDLAAAITEEMGAPTWLTAAAQVGRGQHLSTARDAIRDYRFQQKSASTLVLLEPIGVCALITPWNWPLNQITCKVAPALAAGCTMVLKPSEIAPLSAYLFAEIMDAAGVPPGVFNLVNGDGPTVGAALAGHRDVDMVSITGSTRAGIEVAHAAASTVKRVHQELGGKSPNIILDDSRFAAGVRSGTESVMVNSGQSCDAPTRMLVPARRMDEAIEIARQMANDTTVGDPLDEPDMGPLASSAQWDRVQEFIRRGMKDGATLIAGGLGRPAGLDRGFYARPTVFANVRNDMAIARQEIFGPVLCLIGYDSVDHAIDLANDTEYGLAAYINGEDPERLVRVAGRLRAGRVNINGAAIDFNAPFGGYKRSGNGREWGERAFAEFLETKAVLGYPFAS